MGTLFRAGQLCSFLGAACLAESTFGKFVVNTVLFVRNVLVYKNRLSTKTWNNCDEPVEETDINKESEEK